MSTAYRHCSVVTLLLLALNPCLAQSGMASDASVRSASAMNASSSVANEGLAGAPGTPTASAPVNQPAYARGAWEYGPFVSYGFGTGNRSEYKFFNAGLHAGRVLTPPSGPGILRGQFEYAGEVIPFWQAYTPAPHLQTVTFKVNGVTYSQLVPLGGGTFTGVSITPIILRWNLAGMASGRLLPWIQGAGGLIWTNHKFPPDYLVPHGQPGGTSVFNFTPQFGIGLHYFVGREPSRLQRRSIDFSANAVHISSSSLGDHNPGVNASVQFQLGYTWWK